jgi:hypothetical protein
VLEVCISQLLRYARVYIGVQTKFRIFTVSSVSSFKKNFGTGENRRPAASH